jgi:predicted ArsR family transcriptional regulator
MSEQYLTIAQIAEMLAVSLDTARRLFEREPGVVNVGSKVGRPGRPYRTLRIPRSALERVLAARAVKGDASAQYAGHLTGRKGEELNG